MDENRTVPSGRNFIQSWPLDLSAFLAGETSVDVFVGGNDVKAHDSLPTSTAQNGTSYEKDYTTARDTSTWTRHAFYASRDTDASSAPHGIRSLRLSVCLSGRGGTVENDGSGTLSDQGRAGAGDAQALAGENSRGRRLLSEEVTNDLNPMSITITSAASLPGVRIEAPSLQKYVRPSAHSLPEKHCKDIFIFCRPFPESPLGLPLHPRIIWTPTSAQQDRAQFNHTSAFLLGRIDSQRLEEWAETCTLCVEIHDR